MEWNGCYEVMLLCRGMTSRVAQVMAPLLPGIRTGVGNNGLENGGGGVPKAKLRVPLLTREE